MFRGAKRYRFDLAHCLALIVSQNLPVNSQGRRRVSVTQPRLGYRLACGLEKHTRDRAPECAYADPAVFPRNPEFVDDRV